MFVPIRLPVANENSFICDRLDESEISTLASIVAKAFIEQEPICAHINVSYKIMIDFFKELIEEVFDDKLCFVCRDRKGKIIGGTICYDLDREVSLRNQPEILAPVLALLDEITQEGMKSEVFKKVKQKKVIEIFATAIEPNFAKKGIGGWFVSTVMKCFSDLSYNYLVTQCTSPISQSLAVQANFKTLALMDYSSFEFKGRKPFSGISFNNSNSSFKLFEKNKSGAAFMIKKI